MRAKILFLGCESESGSTPREEPVGGAHPIKKIKSATICQIAIQFIFYIVTSLNKGVNMKPITKDELEFWNNFTTDEFYEKRRSVDTEISQEAQTIADKKKLTFAKECGLDKELKNLDKHHKAYVDFMDNKSLTEQKLKTAWENASNTFTDKAKRLAKVRDWEDIHFDSTLSMEKANRKLGEACYQEAKSHVRKNHKIHNLLDTVQKRCKMIIHTGAHINEVVTSLKGEMSKVEINLEVPKNLLALPSK